MHRQQTKTYTNALNDHRCPMHFRVPHSMPTPTYSVSAPASVSASVYAFGLLLTASLWSISTRAEQPLPKWELGLGIAAARLADYRGSEHGHTYALPVPYGIYRGDRLRLDRDQNRFRIFSTATFSVDWSGAVSQPVKSEDSPRREGMPDLEPTLEWGPQLKVALGEHWLLQTRLHVVTTHEDGNFHDRGYTVTPSVSWETPLFRDFSLGAKLAAPTANDRYHDYYYGVSPDYALPDRPVYHGHGGASGLNTQLTLSKRTRHAWYGVFFSNHFLENSVIEDSPLIDDKTSWSAGFAATWLIFQSSEHATATPLDEKG